MNPAGWNPGGYACNADADEAIQEFLALSPSNGRQSLSDGCNMSSTRISSDSGSDFPTTCNPPPPPGPQGSHPTYPADRSHMGSVECARGDLKRDRFALYSRSVHVPPAKPGGSLAGNDSSTAS